jgi:hypothetical protein
MKNRTQNRSSKIKIGVLGEHPSNDSEALCHLLRPLATENVQFVVILKKLRGSQFDNEQTFLKALKSEFLGEDFHHIILIRDLDGLLSEKPKIKMRDTWFNNANKFIENKGIFFLAIAEMEALILADIETFNKMYGLSIKPIGNPMMVSEPKEDLQRFSDKSKRGKYAENNAPDIFKTLNFRTIYKNHKGERSFQTFADELKDKRIINF